MLSLTINRIKNLKKKYQSFGRIHLASCENIFNISFRMSTGRMVVRQSCNTLNTQKWHNCDIGVTTCEHIVEHTQPVCRQVQGDVYCHGPHNSLHRWKSAHERDWQKCPKREVNQTTEFTNELAGKWLRKPHHVDEWDESKETGLEEDGWGFSSYFCLILHILVL